MKRSHAHFSSSCIHAALLLALGPGFGLAVWMAAQMGWGWSLSPHLAALIQLHGHAQVYGWIGLFIMGVSLYFIPRFAGVPLRFASMGAWIAACILSSVFLRAFAFAAFVADSPYWISLLWFSALAFLAGVGTYIFLLLSTLRAADPRRAAIRPLFPYFFCSLCGWSATAIIVQVLTLRAIEQRSGLLHPYWNAWCIDLFVGLVLLPVAFAFSIRTFPLYLRLAAVRWDVERYFYFYLGSFILSMAAAAYSLYYGGAMGIVEGGARLAKGVVLVVFVWSLDLLTRRKEAWIIEREGEPAKNPTRHRRPRSGMPDYGEFGHFEWLVYAAYGFLVVAALAEVYSGLGVLSGGWLAFDASGLRHVYLAGFGTLLLLGMAPRMVPGFAHRRGPASPLLVDLSFFFGVSAVLLRLLPVVVPATWWGQTGALLFGLSGFCGWLAVALLAANLWVMWLWDLNKMGPAPFSAGPKETL